MRLLIIPLLILTLALTACATGDRGDRIDRHEAALQLVVRAAVGRALDQHPLWAAPAMLITAAALDKLQGDSIATVGGLEQSIIASIAWSSLNPEEQALVQVLIQSIRSELTANLEEKGVSRPGEATVKVGKVLFWINQSAKIHSLAGG